MTVTYGFYDSLSGDRKYNALQMSQLFKGMITDGIFDNIGGGFSVTQQSGMNLNVASGRAWFNDTWTDNDNTITVTVATAEVALNRIDIVVIEVNSDIGTRANTIKIIKGTPGSSPVPPTLAATSTLHQYALAHIYVGAGVTSITTINITNKIGTVGGTPWLTGILSNAQIAAINANYNSLLQGWIPGTGTWSYVSADSPTFVMNVPDAIAATMGAGVRIKLTQTTDKYFITTAVGTPSGGFTPVTMYGGTDYTLANAAITNPYYSREKSPYGFPKLPEKWTVSIITSDTPTKTSPTASVWYGGSGLTPSGPSIDLPIGAWRVRYNVVADVNITLAAVAAVGSRLTLSTANNSESDPEMTTGVSVSLPIATDVQRAFYTCQKDITVVAKTTYYLNIFTGNSGASNILMNPAGAFRNTIKAICNYL